MAPQVYAGLFLTTLATLMYEVLLPRVLSVTMVYHFAFMAVSLAMFGMTVGAVVVHLLPSRYTFERVRDDLSVNAILHAITLVASFTVYAHIRFLDTTDATGIATIAATYVVLAVPFVFSGITVALALTRFPGRIAALYAADLAGAATGCFAVLFVLDFTDAPTAVLVIAAMAALGGAAFAWRGARSRTVFAAVAASALLGLASVSHHALVRSGHAILKLWNRPLPESPRAFERWNDHSYVEVFPPALGNRMTLGWGMSDRLPEGLAVPIAGISIDEKAGTGIIRFDGDLSKLDFLRYDVTNAAHQIRHDGDVCVIGVGGGRDVLSALYFRQHSVLGIELNRLLLDLLTDVYPDFSGHLDQNPKVRLVHDEARSFLARTDQRFDILQISLIDTFAATTAGAFALAENSLYTVDAWELFLRRLKPRGVLSVSRYYFHRRPGEAYRMLGLGVEALARRGIDDPRSRLVLLKNQTSVMVRDAGIGTLLLSLEPFSAADLSILTDYAKQMNFEVVLSPNSATDGVLETIANGRNLRAFYKQYPIDISPIDDDRPFFFQMLRMRSVFEPAVWDTNDLNWKNLRAVFVLFSLLVIVVILTALCVLVPLKWSARAIPIGRIGRQIGYFAAIGLGFMFIEMAQMQRLTIFLGHPTYALSVVLFTLLISGGAGSLVIDRIAPRLSPRGETAIMAALLALVTLVGLTTPAVTRYCASASTPARILLAVALLAAAGFPMGMPFPLGMRRAESRGAQSLAWLWGINGATSVCASVLAVILGLSFGITSAIAAGILSYAAAAALHVLPDRGSSAQVVTSGREQEASDKAQRPTPVSA